MTIVSLADACRCLGIDAKTLHRWLTDAQLPLLPHPCDGRKKGVSAEHLHLLARLHQRCLAPLCEEPSVPEASQGPELPAALLALPEQLDALQAQISALHQQVAALTRLLQPPAPVPTSPPTQAQPNKTRQRSATPPAAPSRPAAPAKTPRKPVHVIPRVEYAASSGRYVVTCPKHGVLPLEPDTPEWFAWLKEHDAFRFVGKGGHFTAHHEWRVKNGAWRAHRHLRNRMYTLRLAPVAELTIAVLEQAAETLQARLT